MIICSVFPEKKKNRVCTICLQHIIDLFWFSLGPVFSPTQVWAALPAHSYAYITEKKASFSHFKRNRRKLISQHHHRYPILTTLPISFQLPSKTLTFYAYMSTTTWHKKSLPHFRSFSWTITGYFVVRPFETMTELGFCHPWELCYSVDCTGCVLTHGKEDDS